MNIWSLCFQEKCTLSFQIEILVTGSEAWWLLGQLDMNMYNVVQHLWKRTLPTRFVKVVFAQRPLRSISFKMHLTLREQIYDHRSARTKLGQNKVNRVEKLEKLFFCLEERHLLLLWFGFHGVAEAAAAGLCGLFQRIPSKVCGWLLQRDLPTKRQEL